jgi:mannose-6-phosphate isomerase-like protein (cupin superfamily)
MSLATRRIAAVPDATAPDGSEVRVLCRGERGSMAQFSLKPSAVSKPVAHRSVEELWYIVAGRGRIWRRLGPRQEITELKPGVSITVPTGAHFQFRCDGAEPLTIIGATMPPWPGEGEGYAVDGIWEPSL